MENLNLKKIAKFNIGTIEEDRRVELYIDFISNELVLYAFTILKRDAISVWTKVITKIIPIDDITMETNFKDIIIGVNEEIDIKLETFKTLKELFKDVDSIEVIRDSQQPSE